MTILCGTDFSPQATQAVRVAGLLADRGGQALHVAHVLREESPWETPGQARQALDREAERRMPPGLEPVKEVLSGLPDAALVEYARQLHVELIVIGAVGHRAIDRWLLGSCAERTAGEAPMPVLVVRKARPFEEWLVDGRALQVMVGCEEGPGADAALTWAGGLLRLGPMELVVTQLVRPDEENRRVGFSGLGMGITLCPEALARLLEMLGARQRALAGAVKARLRVIPALGRFDQALVTAAEEFGADLLVVGSHQREGLRRWWHGSVSSGVLQGAPMNVAIVPVQTAADRGSAPAANPRRSG
jgi:nucleotide-binding universal stress UspA family protein